MLNGLERKNASRSVLGTDFFNLALLNHNFRNRNQNIRYKNSWFLTSSQRNQEFCIRSQKQKEFK